MTQDNDFSVFLQKLQAQFEKMIAPRDQKHMVRIFQTDANPDALWNLYLDSFPAVTNKLYRKRRKFDCSCCRHFMRNFGAIVAVKGGTMVSLWDITDAGPVYQPVCDALSRMVHRSRIVGTAIFPTVTCGIPHSRELQDGQVRTWDHFSLAVPERLVKAPRFNRDTIVAFQRALSRISLVSVRDILSLIFQHSLYRGEEWESRLKNLLDIKSVYPFENAYETERERGLSSFLFACEYMQHAYDSMLIGITNSSIGSLLCDLSVGVPVEDAVSFYERIVAPENYRRSAPIFTQSMIDQAEKAVKELGFEKSLERRFATMDDLRASDMLYLKRSTDSFSLSEQSPFSPLREKAVTASPKDFSWVETIPVDRFVSEILPGISRLEVYAEPSLSSNLFSLLAPKTPDSPSLFRWKNGYSWAYCGGLADSSIRKNVQAAGGNIHGALRFSIQWNDIVPDASDLDAHCVIISAPYTDAHIYYGNKESHGGKLDVDILHPRDGIAAVENIVFPKKHSMRPGTYRFYVNCYAARSKGDGFRAEIEMDGCTYCYDYRGPNLQDSNVAVASVKLGTDGSFTINHALPVVSSEHPLWDLRNFDFAPVTAMFYSPNFWSGEEGKGLRHYFFAVDGCINPDQPNGFFNEFLSPSLLPHKRVFEALGAQMKPSPSKRQVSGFGFTKGREQSVILRITGDSRKVIKVLF